MTTQKIADRLVELCRQGQFDEAQKELYADDAVSIEEQATPAFEKETRGKKAMVEKSKTWSNMVEQMFETRISDPIVGDNSFATTMMMDVKVKGADRMKMTEVCVYKVRDGKIISEQFFS